MPYNPETHHRRSIRLKGYDYSQSGMYFITICTQHRACLFGDVMAFGINETSESAYDLSIEMKLNDAGEMIKYWYNELNNKFNDIKCHAMVVMPIIL